MLLRMAPDAIERLGSRLDARLDRRQRHQRQDDDRRDARLGPPPGRAHPGPQPRRLEHELGRRDRAARAGRRPRACSRSTRRGCRGWSRTLDPRLIVLSQPLPRPARPLRRARAPRRRVGRDGRRARRPAGFVLNADDPLVADLGRDARARAPARRHLLRDRGRVAGAARAPARARRQALPPLRRAVRLRARLRRPPRPLHLPQLRRRPAHARRRRDRGSSCDGMRGLATLTVSTPEGALELALPLPGLYNVYNALAALTAALRLGRRARARPSRPGAHRGRVRAGRDDRGRRQAGLDPPDQEPRRRQRGDAHAAPRGRAVRRRRGHRPVDRAQRPDRRRPGRLVGLGRRLRAAGRLGRAASTCAGTRAPEMAVRLKYAGLDPDGSITVDDDDPSVARSAPSPRRRSASSPCPPTPRCSSCGRCSPSAASRRRTGNERAAPAEEAVIWHDVENGAYEADLALWRELAASARRAGPRARLRHRPRRARPRARTAITCSASTSSPRSSSALRERAAERGLEASAERRRRPRPGGRPASSRWSSSRCRRSSCFAGAEERRRCAREHAAGTWRPAA